MDAMDFYDTAFSTVPTCSGPPTICLYNVNDSVMVASGPWQAFLLKQEDMHVLIQWLRVEVLACHMSNPMVTVFTGLFFLPRAPAA